MADEQYHEDPAVNIHLSRIEAKAAFYALAHGVLTGKFDENFADWQKRQKVSDDEVREVPDTSELVEWAHLDANLSELLKFREVLDRVMTEVNLAIFGKYAQKNVRGSIPADTNLSELRKGLVKTLDGTCQLISDGIIDTMTVDMILNLPTLKKWGKENNGRARRADGTWIIPNAPAEKNGEEKNVPEGSSNFRSHNTQVKFVVDGALFECPTLGEACGKLFNLPAKDVGALFEGWHSDYFAVGDEKPKKIQKRDGREIWLTKA